jgi:hypothetical protein
MNKSHQSVSLKAGIVELFDEIGLDRTQLDALRAHAEPAMRNPDAPAQPSRRRWLAVAASLAAVTTLGIWGVRRQPYSDHLQMLADEVAYNHVAHSGDDSSLDALGDSLASLRPTFAKLGFAMVDATGDPALADATLIGGRFCMLMAAPAVQLRYDTPRGEVHVCQARFDPVRHAGVPDVTLAGVEPVVLHTRGVRVSLAQRAGVLFAVAA